MNILDNLNEIQKEIVLCDNSHILVIAGAGTGKTHTVKSKIQRLFEQSLANPSNLFCTTFTNKAAKELQSRIDRYLPWCGTFHGLAAKLLRQYLKEGDNIPINKNFTIISDYDRKKIITRIINSLNPHLNKMDNKEQIYYSLKYISDKKNMATKDFDVYNDSIYCKYQDALVSANMCDFDDIILYAIQLIESNQFLQEKFKYVFVDEYQDINAIQYKMIKLIVGNNGYVFCVGDDDQSIYGWRGSDIKYILNFDDDFDNVKVFKLERNYRSDNSIVEIANKIILNNVNRRGKTLYSEKNKLGSAPIVHLKTYDDSDQEISEIVETVAYYSEKGNTVGILCRNRALINNIYNPLVRAGVSAYINKNTTILDAKDCKIIFAYLHLVLNNRNCVYIDLAMQNPKRGIGDKGCLDIVKKLEFGESWNDIINTLQKSKRDAVNEFINTIKSFEALDYDLILSISQYCDIEYTDDIEFLNDMLNSKINDTSSSDSSFESTVKQGILSFLEHLTLVQDSGRSIEDSNVQVITIHESKGREFDIVIAPGWSEGLLPSAQSIREGDLEEERRLAYVCITRAKKMIFITNSRRAFLYGKYIDYKPSRFLFEIDDTIKSNESDDQWYDY